VNAEIDGRRDRLKHTTTSASPSAPRRAWWFPWSATPTARASPSIEKEIGELGKKARDGKLTLEELQGGTFTITNGGVFGSMLSTPILNPPQSGILGMHNIQERPVVVNGQIAIRPMMYLALTYDHRIVDGSEAVRFLVTVKHHARGPAHHADRRLANRSSGGELAASRRKGDCRRA
jgi:2-oxoglutarate dehydrogenase E2 component (dihydrolipoamide succinyltransferase)